MESLKPTLQAMTRRCIQIEQYQANVKHLEELHVRHSARHRRLQDEFREGESFGSLRAYCHVNMSRPADDRYQALRVELKQRQQELAAMLNRMDDELRERHDAWIREHVRTLCLLCSTRYRIIPAGGWGSGYRRARTGNHDSPD